MKILVPGNTIPLNKPRPWYHIVKLRCVKCKCVFQIEPKDKVQEIQETENPPVKEGISLNCPSCNVKVTFSKPIEPIFPSNTFASESIFGELFGKDSIFEQLFGNLGKKSTK